MNKFKRIFPVSVLLLCSCVTAKLNEDASNVKVVTELPSSCLQIDDERNSAPPLAAVLNTTYKQNSLVKARNKAAAIGADNVLAKESYSGYEFFYFTCGPIEQLSESALEQACDYKQGMACAEISSRARTAKQNAKAFAYTKLACSYNHRPSCDWLADFQKEKAALKAKCLAKDGSACLSAALFADIEMDSTLMMTFLKQGCSYGHAESCFYQNYAQEERERSKEEEAQAKYREEVRYRQYMARLQEQSLRQQEVIAAMAVITAQPRQMSCVTQRSGYGMVTTNCR